MYDKLWGLPRRVFTLFFYFAPSPVGINGGVCGNGPGSGVGVVGVFGVGVGVGVGGGGGGGGGAALSDI